MDGWLEVCCSALSPCWITATPDGWPAGRWLLSIELMMDSTCCGKFIKLIRTWLPRALRPIGLYVILFLATCGGLDNVWYNGYAHGVLSLLGILGFHGLEGRRANCTTSIVLFSSELLVPEPLVAAPAFGSSFGNNVNARIYFFRIPKNRVSAHMHAD